MKNIINSLAKAKSKIATIKVSKDWENDYSHYQYFTPEQVNMLVQKVCDEFKLLTKFDLIRNEFWMYWTLTIYDLESWESLVFEWASELPDIKATVSSQRYGWLMTYLERYLKMTAFWICSNELDLDTTENTRKVAEKRAEKDITKEWPFTPNNLPWFNKDELEQLKWNEDWVKGHETSDSLIQAISTKYRISKVMKQEIADYRASL
jgi:hypothetical protein